MYRVLRARLKSLTRAAQVLNMTQPALSKTLARLREHFNDQLFVRVAFQMKPTSKALGLAPQIAKILEELSLLQSEQVPFSPMTSGRDFKFAGPDAAIVLMLPPILKDIHKKAPDVRLTAVPLELEHLYGWLESGEVDLAVGEGTRWIVRTQRKFKCNEHQVHREI